MKVGERNRSRRCGCLIADNVVFDEKRIAFILRPINCIVDGKK